MTLQSSRPLQTLSIILALSVFTLTVGAQTNETSSSSTNPIEELKKLSVEELMQQPVTTVERRTSTIGDSPTAVTVITQEDIHRSGATTIPELLRRVPGMDVAQINGNIWAVSVRGFNDRFANKLQVQIDGRTLYTPLFAGVYWDAVDYPLEDIERIEVVRGPGASVWGANAVNGVINIITKSANETQGGLLTVGGGNEELGFGTLRYGAKVAPDVAYRVYVKGFDQAEQFSPVLDPNDNWASASFGTRVDWNPNDLNSLMFEGGFLRSIAGQSNLRPMPTPPFAFLNLEDENANAANVLGRWIHQLEDQEDNSWTVQLYWDRVARDSDNQFANYRWDTFDADFSQEFKLGERQKFVYGFGYRYMDVFGGESAHDAGFTQDFIPAHSHLQLASAFGQDQFALVEDKFYLIGGTKFEHNDFTGVEFQPTGRLLWTPTTNQSAWFAVSRAVRTPSLAERDLRLTGAPIAPGVLPQVQPNNNFISEELLAFELGYRAQVTRSVSMDACVFHNEYNNLSVGLPLPPTPRAPPIIVPLFIVNNASGTTDGAELAATWLTVSDIDGFANQNGMIEFKTEEHRVSFTINRIPVETARLKLSSKLLRLSQ